MIPVLLGLGANLGDRAAALRAAAAALRRFLNVTAVSPVYQTPPMYLTEQDPFLNQVMAAETDLAPEVLLEALKELERRLGRTPGRRNGPRQIDIDILFYGDRTVARPELTIPHPRMAERGFVLVPAADIAPDWRHPETGLTVAAMREALGPCAEVVRYAGPPAQAAE